MHVDLAFPHLPQLLVLLVLGSDGDRQLKTHMSSSLVAPGFRIEDLRN